MVGGEAGYGIMASGMLFSKAFSRGGLHVSDANEYPSLIRGGHNTVFVRVSPESVYSLTGEVDILVALNKETVSLDKDVVSKDGGVIFDPEDFKPGELEAISFRGDVQKFPIPLSKLAQEAGGAKIMRNTVAIGASLAFVDYPLHFLEELISEQFQGKGDEVIKPNIAAAKAGYDFVKTTFPKPFKVSISPVNGAPKRMFLTGNEAIALGAIQAGCKFYSAYPMTPASTVLHNLAAAEKEHGLVVRQVEDELSAINTAIGASVAGVRAMTGTSGGGFALMSEAVGFAGMIEAPLVIYEAQRGGPSTGLPTRTEQGDLRFLIHASQGEFPKVVIALSDVEDSFYLTMLAFNIAEKYQLPVIITGDKYLGECHWTCEPYDLKRVGIERGKLVSEADLQKGGFKRYAFTEDGVSPRWFPGMKGGIHRQATDEHEEDGVLSEEPENRLKMVDKRARKLEGVLKDLPPPILYGSKDAEITFIGWGSTKGAVREAMRTLEEQGVKCNYIHVISMHPFHSEEVKALLKNARKTLLVEGNSTGQLLSLLKENCFFAPSACFFKYSGRPILPSEVLAKAKEVL